MISVEYKPIKLTPEQYAEYLKSSDIVQKFIAFSHEIQNIDLPKPYAFMRIMTYLEWFFDKVIEKKIQDEVTKEILQNFNFQRKMDLIKDWEILIDDNYHDINKLREIRNEFAHTLIFDDNYVSKKLSELKRYSDEKFEGFSPFDKAIAIVMDVCSVLTNAINTGFQFKPTPKPKK